MIDRTIPETARQHRRVVELLCEGMSNDEMARALCVSKGTVKQYVSQILRRLGYKDRLKLVSSVLQEKIRALETEVARLRGGRAA